MKENEHFPKKSKPPKLTLSGENWLAYFFFYGFQGEMKN